MQITPKVLRERQGWSLQQKIDHSLGVIDQFYHKLGGKVFVSFSGGKDSTVMLDLCRIINPDILAVFSNTGNEDPSVVALINKRIANGENIRVIRPKMTPRQVWEKWGFPLVSKETSYKIQRIRHNPICTSAQIFLNDRRSKYCLPNRWFYLLDEPYDCSHHCCDELKKKPMRRFMSETGLSPFIGTMACESEMRKGLYMRGGGCNRFDVSYLPNGAESLPLSIWMEEDILEYIRMRKLETPEIYHKGARRTGCVGCGFGAMFPDDVRFDLLYDNYPKYYNMIMEYENNGVTYREALRKMFAKVGKTLPDERGRTLFDLED